MEKRHKKTRVFPGFLSSGACAAEGATCAAEGAAGIEPPFASANMNPALVMNLSHYKVLFLGAEILIWHFQSRIYRTSQVA